MNTGLVPCTDELSEDQLAWWRKSVLELLWRIRDIRLPVLFLIGFEIWRLANAMSDESRSVNKDDSSH